MASSVAVPLWLLLIMAAATLWAALSWLLIPTVRWFFRRRVNQLIEEVNRRLDLQLPTFSLTKRQVLIDRLAYDPAVLAEVREYCEETGTPWAVGLRQAETYAREIVPAFNAYVYFRIGHGLARAVVRRFYRVRLAHQEGTGRGQLDRDASVVFVINHRSNMDYMLVTYLAEEQAALSYAVGEWARVWPLEPLIRAMGAYFVRRDARGNTLYHRVLERYVQMAVDGGVVQAVFPEGGLSRDGHPRKPRIGLVDYMLRNFDPGGSRDILFVPVGLNYDRVLEDRTLLAEKPQREQRRSTVRAMGEALVFLARNLGRRLRGRRPQPTYAAAGFGAPVSARAWFRARNQNPRVLGHRERLGLSRDFVQHLMGRVASVMPVLPVPLVCWLLVHRDGMTTRSGLESACREAIAALQALDEPPAIPYAEPRHAVAIALAQLADRDIVTETPAGALDWSSTAQPLLTYYAASLEHLLPPSAAERGAEKS